MSRTLYTLTIYQGEDFRLEVLWENEAGEPIDLSTYTAASQIRQGYSSVTPIIEFSSEVKAGLGLIELGADGLVVMTASNALTAAVSMARPGVWDLELTSPGEPGSKTRLAEGPAKLSRESTR